MNLTFFLAALWGPVLLAVGLGILGNPAFYRRIYRDLDKSPLAVLVFGMIAMTIGLLQITYHSSWNTLPQVLVSFLGWGCFLKGVIFLIVPDFVDRAGDMWAKLRLIPVAGILTLAVGGYLTAITYFF